MKTSGHLILYISENEDFELWRVLSQISPDDRAAFVKTALRKALLSGNDSRNSPNWTKQSNVLRMEKSYVDSPVTDLALEELGYHSLAGAEERVKPLRNLTNEGRHAGRDHLSEVSYRPNVQDEDNLSSMQLDELLKPNDSVNKNTIPGLSFLLTNVIGEEDDEKVIEFIRNNKTASGENN
jgi:hypothetical protein